MKKGNKNLFLLLALVVVVGAVVLFLPSGEQEAVVVEEAATEEKEKPTVEETTLINKGDQAPDFTVTMISGETVSLESLKGKVVMLNFWATWCPPCQKELKRVQTDVIDHFAGRDFVFLPISRGEEKETVVKFLEENGYTFPVGLDLDQSIYKLYASNYIPRNFIINRHGVVVEATVGYEPEELDAMIQLIDMTINAR